MSEILKKFAEPMHRVMSVEGIDSESRTLRLAFSSDVELERWPGIAEKLSHAQGAVDLSRLNDGAALLFNHDENQHLGVVESATVAPDGKGRAVVRFGKSDLANEKWQDVQDKTLSKVSVGYRINEVKLTKESENGPDVYTVTSWTPYEISMVTIPADPSVGTGRNLTISQETPKTQFMDNNTPTPAPLAPAVAPVEPKINISEVRENARKEEITRRNELKSLGTKYGVAEAAEEAIEKGLSVDEARSLFLDAVNKKTVAVSQNISPVGLSDKEARSFSFVKLIRAAADPQNRKFQDEARFELEVCAAAADKATREVKGLLIPVDVLTAPMGGKRSEGANIVSEISGSGYTGTASNTVQTSLLASSFIDVLRNKTLFAKMVRQLTGLVGNVDLPKQLNHAAGYWIAEDGTASQQGPDFGIIPLSPKTVANYGAITRRTLLQSSLAIEQIVREDLIAGIALAIDTAGFYGTGTSGQPTGIKNTSGINLVDFATSGAPTFKELVDMETLIAQGNADVESMAYVINPTTRGYAKVTRRLSTSTDSNTIWEPGNTINGYQVGVSNQITSGDVFFGNFSDAVLGLWSGLELILDPYTNSKQGRINIVTMQDVDIAVRRGQSFTYGTFVSGSAGETLSGAAGA